MSIDQSQNKTFPTNYANMYTLRVFAEKCIFNRVIVSASAIPALIFIK